MRKGFTLTEVLVAMSLFAVVATIATTVLMDIVQLERKSSVQNAIYEDARLIFQQISNEIQAGTIDYEEYYSMNVVQKKKLPAEGPYYGINYGVYASRFFDPGKSHDPAPNNVAKNPDDLGVECSFPDPLLADKDCEIYFTNSADFDTGQNPYEGSGLAWNAASSVCDSKVLVPCAVLSNVMSELYLIDSSGTHKTILAKKKMTVTDDAIGIVRMTGHDLDQNGIVDVFGCDPEFICEKANIFSAIKYPFIQNMAAAAGSAYLATNNISLPKQSDLNDPFDPNVSHFIPITPQRVSVKDLKFIINPLEDPYRAYSEENMQTHPTVTVVMTLGLSAKAKKDYPGDFADITIQTTVAVGVIGKIDSYPPVNDVLRNSVDTSWIYDVFN